MLKLNTVVLILILFCVGVARGQQPLILNDEQNKYPLGQHMVVLEDTGSALTIEQVSSPEYAGQFKPSPSMVPNLGYTQSALWVRIILENRSSIRSPWVLELLYPNMNHVDLYMLNDLGRLIMTKKTGNRLPVSTRDHPYHNLVFLLSLPRNNPRTLILRFKSNESMTVPLSLWSMTRFMERSQISYLLNGIFIGLLLVTIGFHLFLFGSLRDRNYLYYSISIIAALLYAIVLNGFASTYLWSDPPSWSDRTVLIFSGLLIIAVIKFADEFLQARANSPLVHRITNLYLIIEGMLIILSLFFSYRLVIYPLIISGILGALLLMTMGLISLVKGFQPARYFLAAITFIGSCGILYYLVRLGILPSLKSFENGIFIGIVLYVILMSLALAARIRILKSDKERATQELIESEERFRSLVETTYDFIWEVDREGIYTYVSPKCADLIGFFPHEILGTSKFKLMRSKEAARVSDIFNQKMADHLPIIGLENRLIHKNGKTVVIDTNGLPFFDGKGNLLGYRGIDREITDRLRLEEERLNLHAQIQHSQKLESLGVLAGGIAHDFNNLLMGVLGNASLTLKSLENPIEARRYVEKIEKSAHQAAKLTNQMLAYSGKGRFVIQPLNLSDLVLEMTQLLKVSISKNITIRFDFSPDLPDIQADISQISQVIMNLIVNASEAIGDKTGVISVRTGIQTVDKGYMAETYFKSDLPEGEYVFLEISDNGIGMDRETQHKIFDPFFTTKFKGHGLGLAAVLGIVRGHKGTIKVYSEPGRGTTIKVFFPSEKAVKPKKPRRKTIQHTELTGKTVLVVDDEPTVRQVVRDMLESQGMKVIVAAHGKQGVELYRKHQKDIFLVLLDTTMPEMNGEEVFKRLRKLNPDVQVILISGYNEQEATSFFVGKGLAGFIQKPFTLEKLFERLNELSTEKNQSFESE
jgi:PAS domain S-box-containing protein